MIDRAPDWVEYNARRAGRALAMENMDTGARRTWADTEDRVARTAGMLVQALDVAAGDRVALIAENDFRLLEIQFACMRIGAILVPLNWRLMAGELGYLLQDADAKVLIHDHNWADTAVKLADTEGIEQVLGWSADGGAYDVAVAAAAPIAASNDARLDDVTHILYTSGTTGRPKGALVTHRTLTAQVANVTVECVLGLPDAKYLNPMPMFHAGGLTTLAAPIMATGGAVAFGSRFDPQQCLDWLSARERGVTHFNGAPIFFESIAALPGFAGCDFSHIRHAHVAGTTIADKIVADWDAVGLKVQQFYGGTEMGPSAMGLPEADIHRKTRSCGLPLKYTSVRLVDPAGHDVAPGDSGEVWLSGPAITPGYWRRERSPDAFDGEWFRTGDVARQDDEGYFYIVDRLKDMYKSGGENVFPAEIEQALLELPSVAEVAIVGVPDERWGEVGMAVIVPAAGPEVTLEGIVAHLQGRFARYKLPKSLRLQASLPRNVLGKIDKKALRTAP